MSDYHIPVLLEETVSSLQVEQGKKYIDATLGGGGHTREILNRGGNVLALDVDQDAIDNARKRLDAFLETACPPSLPDKRVINACPSRQNLITRNLAGSNLGASPQNNLQSRLVLAKGNFAHIFEIAEKNNFGEVDGILYDLGVSSHQLESKERGFSFNTGSVLDMRMDQNLSVKALDLVNGLNEGELYELFSKLGEEHHSRAIAHAIVVTRKIKPITTCDELALIAIKVQPRRGKFDRTHPATRIFQALRIAVNDELNNLKESLPQALRLLKPGGRVAVISFHSLEDRIVKNFFIDNARQGVIRIITKHPVGPTVGESKSNPRSRSAKLRVAEKI